MCVCVCICVCVCVCVLQVQLGHMGPECGLGACVAYIADPGMLFSKNDAPKLTILHKVLLVE